MTARTGIEEGDPAEPTEGVEPVETNCAEVVLDLASPLTDRPLTYRIPPALLAAARVGVRAVIPFGPRTTSGVIVGVHPCGGAGDRPLRDILDIPDHRPLFSDALLALALRVGEETVASLRDAVRCLVPPEISRRRPRPERPQEALLVRDRMPPRPGPRQRLILDTLASAPEGVRVADLVRAGGREPLRRLITLGAVRVADVLAAPPGPAGPIPARPTSEQIRLVPEPPMLLWGDTEARHRWIADAVASASRSGMRSLLTVPETALTPGLAAPLRERWGGRVAEFHSSMPEARRLATWMQILAGEIDVLVGTRSALFAPIDRLGLILVDEEQDPSYKADGAPRYHGRSVALARGQIEGAQVVLASPAPSLEAYAAAVEGRMRRVRLPASGPAVRITVVDMRAERMRGRGGILARPLLEAIRRHLREGGRVALFVNRVGYARVLVCRECGRAVRCPRCEVPMPYDGETRTIQCRVCGMIAPAPDVCPQCRGVALRWLGAGTTRVLEIVRRLFPSIVTVRLDRETERGFGAVAEDFAAGRTRLVVGTQLLLRARRLRPSLVGVVDADTPLYRPDFRATERTFQDLHALLSIASRGQAPPAPDPEVVIQTGVPEHPVITALQSGEDEALYREELRVRQEFGYPPFTHLARLIATSRDRESAHMLAARAAAIARECGVEVLGPAPIVGGQARGAGIRQVRAQCVLRSSAAETVRAAARAALAGVGPLRGSRLVVDMDPQEMH